jgi:hypothetical protein
MAAVRKLSVSSMMAVGGKPLEIDRWRFMWWYIVKIRMDFMWRIVCMSADIDKATMRIFGVT